CFGFSLLERLSSRFDWLGRAPSSKFAMGFHYYSPHFGRSLSTAQPNPAELRMLRIWGGGSTGS
ncbi:hypothetical protein FRC10_003930, partial [Ceratobasidium sp. 414]